MLGVSIEQLRSLIRSHIVKEEDSSSAPSMSTFHASDLVVLRVLAGMSRGAARA